MPTIIRKSAHTIVDARREIYRTLTWHVRANTWSPPTDIYETEENLVVRLELAGMKEEDFEVAVDNNVLIISGNRSDSSERRAYHQMEIRFGRFDIAVDIRAPVQLEGASAHYKDGLLVIQLPKASPDDRKVE